MPRFNDEEKDEVANAVNGVAVELADIVDFVNENGPKGMARKLERALELLDRVKEDLDK